MLTLVHSQPQAAIRTAAHRSNLLALIRETIMAWRARSRAREALSRLDDRLLADIGLTREKQFVECNKVFWQA
jgi:uncharacterized protein YjiS (DUF1127 family)